MKYNKIRELLTIKGITMPQLADKIGMSKAGIYQAINKKRLSVDTLEMIAKVLDVQVSDFFENQITHVVIEDSEVKRKTLDELNRVKDSLDRVEKQLDSSNYVIRVTSTIILSMGNSYYQYLDSLEPTDKIKLQSSELGKKIENLLSMNWDEAILDYKHFTKMIEGKNFL